MGMSAPRLSFDIEPLASAGRIATARLSISIDGTAVWPVLGETGQGLEIQIDDLLAYFTEYWKPLILRQVYPIPVNPYRPSDLRREAVVRWAALGGAIAEREETAVSAFEDAHDLSRSFGGLFGLPHFWMMRSGNQMIVETAGRTWHLPFAETCEELGSAGDWIRDRLVQSDPVKWARAADAWASRDHGDAAGLLAWSAGLDRELAQALISEGALEAPQSFTDAANDNDELRIAARMAGALPEDQIREILSMARGFKGREAGALVELSTECTKTLLDRRIYPPFVQGEVAAARAREVLHIASNERADIFAVAKALGVEVRSLVVEPRSFDGLAIWGTKYGPGAFLNTGSGRHRVREAIPPEENVSLRVTLAHELCHLLLDGDHTLGAIEVLKSRMPPSVEQRAKSFAGEFLLPTSSAAALWIEKGRPSGRQALEELVEELARQYGVTRSVAAWKLQHAAQSHEVDLDAILDSIAPRR
ncbi:ImmA/IrrE family metallo-endopeptidase [Sphingomonas sp. LB-2]|uniref:ImmA/IrrE family metallo-endopeptidase n=1 Tax=Sphingomonas caeni TaxID=2984949 RepID=UPI0022300292|nr:ImmA/IrrE family metallo-endopeptidase [Sphingomonas caeni]MCW3848899.1 ImmA/IrrE family metallo-endopeptidase [Sphingomonas caeni]